MILKPRFSASRALRIATNDSMDVDIRKRRGGGRNGLWLAPLVLALAAPALAQTYTVIDLGTLGATPSSAYGLNNNGQVVGSSYVNSRTYHAFLYSGGTMIDLGTLGGNNSQGIGINDSGQVVGQADTVITVGSVQMGHAFLYNGQTMQDLGTMGMVNDESVACGINASGQMGGEANILNGDPHAFLYAGGYMHDLGTLGGDQSFGQGINASGQVVGYSNLTRGSDTIKHAFLYKGATMQDLGTLGGASSKAWHINAGGQVVGDAYTSAEVDHAFLFDGKKMIDLGTLGGATSVGWGINTAGQVVGEAYTATGADHAFLYSGGAMTDLNGLVTLPSGVYLTQATDINDHGQIIANGSDNHPYLLTPLPVPAVSSLSPPSAPAGGTAFTLTVNGTNFVSGATVQWNGTALATTFVSAMQLTAVVPATLITSGGPASVTVVNPGGATSTAAAFTIVSAPALVSPANGAIGVLLAPTLTWNPAAGATSYDVYFGADSPPPLVTNTVGTSYSPATLNPSATYYWQIAAKTATGSTASAVRSFTTGSPAAGLRFVPVTPCRVADTRGGPAMAGGSTRSFAVAQSGCGIPGTAQAYSLNVTVVPEGRLSYLTLWPTGQPQAMVSTLNSWGGIVVANAAIVPAGTNGAVSVFASDPTDVILDVNGYFDTSSGPTSYAFYPSTPCRIADTRGATGQFGGPYMYGGQTRDFPIPSSGCGLPATARAYSLNFTVVPGGYLGYLSAWPTGQAAPVASTLNSWTGKVVANAALVPAGTNESISVYVSDSTQVILDGNGYFAAPGGAGALNFYPVTPCRVADTRGAAGPFGGPEMGAGATRSFAIPASACNIPATAAAYSMNVTVVPDGRLSYLSAWPAGSSQPVVSTLNSWDGAVVANAAIVPAGTGGAISLYVSDQTQVILDINGYFAP